MEGEKTDTEGKVETEKMNKEFAMTYDVHSKMLEDLVGDHFHLGFYDSSSVIPGSDVNSAQTRMIEAALRFASVSEDPSKKPRNILDVGCGIGGSTRYLASKYGSQCKGITLSPFEAERARVLTAAQGLESQPSRDVKTELFVDGARRLQMGKGNLENNRPSRNWNGKCLKSRIPSDLHVGRKIGKSLGSFLVQIKFQTIDC